MSVSVSVFYSVCARLQADASGTAAALYLLLGRLGVHCWIDMRQDSITLQGMQQGVRDSSSFVLILTEHVLGSWFCNQEILTAIEEQKQIQLILEEEPRFFPFDVNAWDEQKRAGQSDRVVMDAAGTKVKVAAEICQMIDRCLPNAVTFRRRQYEQDAMICELCNRIGLALPDPVTVAPAVHASETALQVVVISNAKTAAKIVAEVLPELVKSSRRVDIRSSPTKEDVVSADRVFLVLSKGILEEPTRSLLEEAIRIDRAKSQDRIVAMYSEDAGWHFGCNEHTQSSKEIRNCLNRHEAITYRKKDPDGPKRHEFPAMVAHLRAKLIGVGSATNMALLPEGIPEGRVANY